MKNNLHSNALLFKMIVLVTCFMLVILYNQSKAAGLPTRLHNNNKVAVNFKHDTHKNEVTIRVKSGSGATMQLFIFSPDGILVKEVSVSVHQTTTIKDLKNGFYLYECFDNDQRMKSGSLVIK